MTTTEPDTVDATGDDVVVEDVPGVAVVAHDGTGLPDVPPVPAYSEFMVLAMQARMLSQSEVAPKAFRDKPAVAFHVGLIGRDLGLSLSSALELIDVIDDRPSLSPQLRSGQIKRLGLGSIVPAVRTPERCVVLAVGPHGLDPRCSTRLPDHHEDCRCDIIGSTEFTWEDAQIAGLVREDCEPLNHSDACRAAATHSDYKKRKAACKSNWRTYPKRMLQWRACLPERAEALTPDGWVTHDKLNEGDTVLGYNMETGCTEWATVEAVTVFDARQTYEISHTRFRAVATAGHEWVCRYWDDRGPVEKRRTDDLDSHPYRQLVVAAPMVDTPSDIDADDAARIGWAITDGHISWRGNSPTITIAQTKHFAEVRRLFGDRSVETLHPATSSDFGESREHYRWRMGASESRRLLGLFGVATKDDAARIPAQLDDAGRRAMFRAMCLANGDAFCTGHRAVMDCWQILAAMMGVRTGRPRFNRGSWRTKPNGSPVVSVKRLSIVPAVVEPVWCPTTSLGTWVARIDDQVTITGNTGFCADDYFPESSLGLYSPDEIGAMTDADGNVIDVESVELPEGYDERRGGRGGRSGPAAVVDEATAQGLRARANTLPAAARRELKTMLNERELFGFPSDLPASKVRIVTALLDGLEVRAADGDWGPWTKPEPASAPDDTPTPQVADDGIEDAVVLCERCGEEEAACVCDEAASALPAEPDTAPVSDPDARIARIAGNLDIMDRDDLETLDDGDLFDLALYIGAPVTPDMRTPAVIDAILESSAPFDTGDE